MASGTENGRMEEQQQFASNKQDTKISDKNATADFIIRETGRHNGNINTPKQESVAVDLPINTTKEILEVGENGYNNSQPTDTPNSDTLITDNLANDQSIGSGLESDIEDNDHDVTSERVVVKEPDFSIDDNLPETVTLLKTPNGSKCYLIGTAHFSLNSQDDVSKIIQAVQPHVIVVELCKDRINVLHMDEETVLEQAKSLSVAKIMDIIKQHGTYKGLLYIVLLNVSAHLTKTLGLAPGGEFRRAFAEASKIPNCLIHLGDRPINITVARATSALSWWQTIKLVMYLLFTKNTFSQIDIEKHKSRDAVEEMMNELAKLYPAIKEVFVKERDIYLTHSLQCACRSLMDRNGEQVPARVVGIVGIGHSFGIAENWGKIKHTDIPPIMKVPPPTLTSKILKYTFNISVVGTIIYVGYKLIPSPISLIQSAKSSVEGLIKVSGK